jgi:hypothetical protein
VKPTGAPRGLLQVSAGDSLLASRVQADAPVTFLVFSALAIVVLGLFWLLQRLLARPDSACAPWWHFGIAALLFAASTVLVYLTG